MAKRSRSARVQAWGPYVRCIADLMTLRDWTFVLDDDAPDDGTYANIDCRPGRRLARIRLSDFFLDNTDESEQRHTIVHELFHAHWDLPARMAERRFGRNWEDFRDPFEHSIDASAEALAPHLPLPSHLRSAGSKKG